MKNIFALFSMSMLLLLTACVANAPLEKKSAIQIEDTSSLKPLMSGLIKGNSPPEFSLSTLDGRILTLVSFNGTPVLLYFFTTWCPYCAEDFSALSGIYADYEADIQIVAVDMDLGEDEEKISEYRKRYPALSGVIFTTGNIDMLSAYQIKYTTTKYAIGGDGKLFYVGSGALSEGQWKILLDALKKSE